MEILLNRDGSRNTDYRPRINMENLQYNVVLYDPLGYNLNSGLYERNYGMTKSWANYIWQAEKSGQYHPAYRIGPNGQIHRPFGGCN